MKWIRMFSATIALFGLTASVDAGLFELGGGCDKGCGCAEDCQPECCKPTIARPCCTNVYTYQRKCSDIKPPCCDSSCAPDDCCAPADCCNDDSCCENTCCAPADCCNACGTTAPAASAPAAAPAPANEAVPAPAPPEEPQAYYPSRLRKTSYSVKSQDGLAELFGLAR